jgi:hypothetical protein
VGKLTCPVLRGGSNGNIASLTRPFKRGRKFGTILVDLVRHAIIDLLAERSSQSAADWMRKHPEIAYVSRDRGNGIDPILGGTQMWKLSPWRFIKSDENVRKEISYPYKYSILYR